MADKSITDYTDQELRQALVERPGPGLVYSYNDVINEIERRRQQRNADRVYKLSILAIIISVLSLFGSLLTALLK